MSRRTFIVRSTIATSVCLSTTGSQNHAHAGEFTDRIKKAVKFHMVTEKLPTHDKFRLLMDLGFDGVEVRSMLDNTHADELRDISSAIEKTGLPVHGVINSDNPDLIGAIDQAKALGATSVLHVVRYDTKMRYLENYRETQETIRTAVEHAEKQQVSILIENVWASYLIEPLSMARFIDEINSPMVQSYFDIGNVVRWGWPQHWIEVLGSRIKKLDVKEYDLKVAMSTGMRNGFDVPMGEGSIEWDKVREELMKIDYRGWATAEVRGGDRKRLAEIGEQMNRVLDL